MAKKTAVTPDRYVETDSGTKYRLKETPDWLHMKPANGRLVIAEDTHLTLAGYATREQVGYYGLVRQGTKSRSDVRKPEADRTVMVPAGSEVHFFDDSSTLCFIANVVDERRQRQVQITFEWNGNVRLTPYPTTFIVPALS